MELGSDSVQALCDEVETITAPEHRWDAYSSLLRLLILGEKPTAPKYKYAPVDIQTFIEDPYYLNKKGTLYPKVLEELIEINSGNYVEVVFTGGIGSAKTTSALYTVAYQLYLLSCMINPHAEFGLDRSTEILFIFQSINTTVAKRVDYNRFKAMVEESDYFKNHFPFSKDIESKLVFPNRIEVVPVSGAETATIGQNVIGGLIDELNYMSIVEKSKQSVDGGTYNQAIALYNSIARRRKSRFMSHGSLPGILCLVSSKRYPGQFTDLKEEEAKKDKTIYIYDYRVWDVKPPGSFSDQRFRVFIGDETRKPMIMEEPGVDYSWCPPEKIDEIPMDFLEDFRSDIINALREIAGVSTLARFPFMMRLETVKESMVLTTLVSQETVDFKDRKLVIYPKRLMNPDIPRWAHLDLAISGDSAGFCVGCCSGFEEISRGDFIETLPLFHLDMVLEIVAPKNGEILFYKIRELIYTLRKMGLNIQKVSADSFESRDTLQELTRQGYQCGLVSVDTTNLPYEVTKQAYYDGRVSMPPVPKVLKEFASLEKDPKTGKIDHPPLGSKDLTDAIAGVVYSLTWDRATWAYYSVPLVKIPDSIVKAAAKEKLKSKKFQ